MSENQALRRCFRDPIPEISDAARYLDAAVSAHLSGHGSVAAQLFALANDRAVWNWTDSVWGRKSNYVKVTKAPQGEVPQKAPQRMPTSLQKSELHKRDGYHCRYCGIPVIRSEIRKIIHSLYPQAVQWGTTNTSQHAAFQAMWAQYDHVVPHAHGGRNDLDNLVVACASCNFGKMQYTLAQLGLVDPRLSLPTASQWDGLERIAPRGR